MEKIEFDFNSVKEVRDSISKYYDNMLNIYDKLDSGTKETKKCFDTPAGQKYREEVENYLNKRKDYLQEKYYPFIQYLDKAMEEYNKYLDEVNKKVGDLL